MSNSSYDGLVQMQPNFENGEFFSGDDDFTYQVPRVYFECLGEINDSQSVFDWNDASVITFKDNRAVKYTECSLYELLMTDAKLYRDFGIYCSNTEGKRNGGYKRNY